MNVAQPPPAGRIRWMPGQSLARVGRLARKELSEILRDRLMPRPAMHRHRKRATRRVPRRPMLRRPPTC